MKSTDLLYATLVSILLAGFCPAEAKNVKSSPGFGFDIWASPPSRKVFALSRELVVLRILYAVGETALSIQEIADKIEIPEGQILEKLNEMSNPV